MAGGFDGPRVRLGLEAPITLSVIVEKTDNRQPLTAPVI